MSRTLRTLRRVLVPALAGALLLGVAGTPAQAATDAPASPRSVTTTSARDTWLPGVMASVRDVDTYRFTTTATRYARVLLGDLGADYRLRLLDAQGRVLHTSDRSGRANEEVYAKLPAGTYYASVDAPHGKVVASPYVVRFSSLSEGVHVLSKAEYGTGASRELVFEVLNNTSRAIDGAGWSVTGACTDLDGNPNTGCNPGVSATGVYRVVPPRARVSFFTDEIAGRPTYRFTFLPGGPLTFTSKMSARVTSTQALSGGLTIKGTVTNGSTHYACAPTVTRNAYDARGNILSNWEVWISGALRAGASYSWTATKVHPLPKGTVRSAWHATERGPDQAC